MDWTTIGWGTAAGLATGFATLLGALPLLVSGRATEGRQDVMLGFAAGVMLSASYLSLIVPAADFARGSGWGAFSSAAIVALSVLVGAASLDALRRSDKFSNMKLDHGTATPDLGRRVWLLVIAMTAHNLPEGAAVGVAFGAGDPKIALSTALGIGIQNLPEGLAVAVALRTIGWSPTSSVLAAGATGIMEPLGAVIAVTLVTLASSLLPIGMGWAAGAMLYIVAAELIPAVHNDGSSRRAIAALMFGLAAMLLLDIALS